MVRIPTSCHPATPLGGGGGLSSSVDLEIYAQFEKVCKFLFSVFALTPATLSTYNSPMKTALTSKPATGISKLSHKHHAILDYIVANPETKLGIVAKKFDVSQSWLSTIIHSDLFQHQLQEMLEGVHSDLALSIHDKLDNIAHLALDRLENSLRNEDDTEVLRKTAGQVLEQAGYTSRAPREDGVNTQNNTFIFANRELIERTSKNIGQTIEARQPALESANENNPRTDSPSAAEELPSGWPS